MSRNCMNLTFSFQNLDEQYHFQFISENLNEMIDLLVEPGNFYLLLMFMLI